MRSATNTKLPLDGIKVLDLGWFLPTPFCSLLLADMGAEVIKIERPSGGDPLRAMGEALFTTLNRNKKSVALDLKNAESLAALYQLVEHTDVFIEGFRPGVAARLRIDHATLSTLNPRLIYLSLSGYGQTGPRHLDPGHDINFLASSGILSIPGHLDEPPRRSGLPMGDLAGAQYAVSAICAALYQRERTNAGSFLDIALAEVSLHLAQVRFADYLAGDGQWKHTTPLNDVFLTADDKEVVLALGVPGEEHFIEMLFQHLGEPFDIGDYRPSPTSAVDQSKLGPVVARLVRSRTLMELKEMVPPRSVPLSPVLLPEEALADPHFTTRGLVVECKAVTGGSYPAVLAPGFATAVSDDRSAPRLGEHTRSVLIDAGVDPGLIGRLLSDSAAKADNRLALARQSE